jgi:hypothetical protein
MSVVYRVNRDLIDDEGADVKKLNVYVMNILYWELKVNKGGQEGIAAPCQQ